MIYAMVILRNIAVTRRVSPLPVLFVISHRYSRCCINSKTIICVAERSSGSSLDIHTAFTMYTEGL